jgi:phosphoribosylformimino-5-aminoimidazole carboxamide ribotide isomerase
MIKPTSSDKLADEDCFDRFILHIIPVIDLLDGQVVHAKQGNRTNYLPIASTLTSSTQPVDIVKAFMAVYPFNTLYIADLNAIQNMENHAGSHTEHIEKIHTAFPNLTLWIDAGVHTEEKAKKWHHPYTKLILGSESFTSLKQYRALTSKLEHSFILSLDFLAQGYTGPHELLESNQYWPQDVIVMTLAKVGANAGADINAIRNALLKAKNHHIYAAGGIRHFEDLQMLKQLNVKGALIASALHQQQINAADLTYFGT